MIVTDHSRMPETQGLDSEFEFLTKDTVAMELQKDEMRIQQEEQEEEDDQNEVEDDTGNGDYLYSENYQNEGSPDG